jgi:class 3 adenylate cyclase
MSTTTDILTEVKLILSKTWAREAGRQAPDIEAVALGANHGKDIEAAVLYADMADSTKLVDSYKEEFAAEMYKVFLVGACRVIRYHDGEITAFDGDRVMAVFFGNLKNTNAAKAALHLHYVVIEINKAIKAQYASTAFSLAYCVGIDTSKLLVTKTGIRQYNDLVWVGPAANHAAKLSALNEPGFPTLITERVYNKLNDSAKLGGTPKQNMWEKRTWTQTGQTIYRSSFWWDQ